MLHHEFGFWGLGLTDVQGWDSRYLDAPITENHMEKNMENEMEPTILELYRI